MLKKFKSSEISVFLFTILVLIGLLYKMTINLDLNNIISTLFLLLILIAIIISFINTIVCVYKKKKNPDENKNWREFELAALETYIFGKYLSIVFIILVLLIILTIAFEFSEQVYQPLFTIIIILKFLIFSSIHFFNGTIKLRNGTYFN